MTTKKQRDLVANMKWPPCPIATAVSDPVPPVIPDGVSISGGYAPSGFAVRQDGDWVVMSADAYAALVAKVNAGIAALERLVGCDASYDLIEHDGVKHCVYCGREYLAADVDEKLCPSEDCPGFVCRAALKEMKK